MRAVVQRVKKAKVMVDGSVKGSINEGLLVYLGVHADDAEKDCKYTADKIINLRIFEDENGKMNKSLIDTKGEILVISQFTLFGDTRKGRRPSYNEAAPPEKGNNLYLKTVKMIRDIGIKTETGDFGAKMEVDYINAGPVTLLVDSFKIF
jgi:D-aminoacyl-tRNA deacylase